jgi:hypothetical protein
MKNSESLENTKDKDQRLREIYANLYNYALQMHLEMHDTGEDSKFEEVDEEILQEIDDKVEPHLEECRPDLIIRRVGGLKFLIIDRDRYEKKREETDI